MRPGREGVEKVAQVRMLTQGLVATNFWQFIDRFEILAHFQLGNFAAAQSQLLPRGQIMISCW